jgi:glycosyltransferase involved in cell wall biosynthesis
VKDLQNPLISVITPCLNSEAYIERTIHSVLGQESSCVEYIVIDGGSTDNTKKIINTYADRISYWCSEPDKGMYDAINKGMRQANGDILAYLNSDDIYYPGTLSFVAQYFAENPSVDLLYGDLNFIGESGCVLYKQSYPDFHLPRFRAMRHAAIGQPAAFWRRSLWVAVGEFDTRLKMASDFEFFIRAGLIGQLVHVPKVLAGFRVHGGSMTQSQIEVSYAEVEEIHRRYLQQHNRWQSFFHRCVGIIEFKTINLLNWPLRLFTRLGNLK